MRAGLTTRQRMIVNYQTIAMITIIVNTLRHYERTTGSPVRLDVGDLLELSDHDPRYEAITFGSDALPDEIELGPDIVDERESMLLALAQAAMETGRYYLTADDLHRMIMYFEPIMAPMEMLLVVRRAVHAREQGRS
jgi:hypothetical protein